MRIFPLTYDPRTYYGGACITFAPLNFKTLTCELESMKIEGMQHLPPGQRAKLAQYKMLSRPVAKAAGTLLRFPTEWQPGKAPRNPRDLIVAGIHYDLFMGRFCDFYIGGAK